MNNNWKKKFFTIYLGQAFSIIGSSTVQFAIVWYLTKQTGSALTLTTAAIAGFLPGAIFGAFAGVFVDRNNRKKIMILADAFIAFSSIFLVMAFVYLGNPPIWLIYLVLFFRGLGGTFHMPAMQATIPTLVPESQLTKAGGWANFVTSGSNILAPMLGALLMDMTSITVVMLVDILGAIFAIICLLLVKIPDVRDNMEQQESSFMDEFKQGFLAMKRDNLLIIALPHYVLVGVLFFPLSSLFPLLVLTHYQGSAIHNGIVEAVFSIGMLICSLILGVHKGINRKLMVFSVSIIIVGICSSAIGMLPASLFWLCSFFCFILGVSATLFNVPFYAYVQGSIAPEKMGRVMSLLLTICTIANPIGLMISGAFSEIVGVNNWFIATGILFILNGLLCFFRVRLPEKKYLLSKIALENQKI